MRSPRRLLVASLIVLAAAAPARAQVTITRDLSRDEVVARLGAPAAERASGEFTFLFYESGCAPRCALNDVVILRAGRVVDAVLATPGRADQEPTGGEQEYVDLGSNTLRAAQPLAYFVDPTLHAARPLVARAYRLPGSFAPGEVEEFERLRRGAAADSAGARRPPE